MIDNFRICPICNTKFSIAKKHQPTIFCSIECRNIAHRTEKIQFVCPICKKTFLDRPKKKRTYCSLTCKNEARHKTANDIEYFCEYCGKKFLAHDQSKHSDGAQRNFCSQICKGKGIAKRQDKHIRDEKSFTCIQCKNKFTRIDRYDRENHFCSLNCFHIYHRGKNHPAWQGGTDKYYGPDWNQQRAAVLKRDNFRCQKCNSNNNPEVHHLVSRKEFKQDWIAMNNLSNLITLCNSCHAILHLHPTKVWNSEVAIKLFSK